MNCKYLKIRTKNYNKYIYCNNPNLKKKIDFKQCKSCRYKDYKQVKELKKKSKKLKKLEDKRYSILTDNLRICYICRKKKKHIHEIYKGSNRQTSMKNGFCIPICDTCHEETEKNVELDKKLKKECQKEFEKTHSRAEFIKLIGKSYL